MLTYVIVFIIDFDESRNRKHTYIKTFSELLSLAPYKVKAVCLRWAANQLKNVLFF